MSELEQFAIFDTSLGSLGVAWTGQGIRRVWLEAGPLRARSRGASLAVEATPPPEVRRAVEGMVALAEGRPFDPEEVRLDMRGLPDFHRRVYEAARRIPVGETTTYGRLAAEVGSPGAARAVGQALARNPFLLLVPCHRIVSASGKLGGFSAHGGVRTKKRLLEREQAIAAAQRKA